MAEESKNVPPYLPYKTLLSSLENLGQGIPPKIDRSIWKNQPGTVQSQILSAYKFLGLMTDTTGPTDTLRDLVQHRATPAVTLKKIIEDKYSPILSHDLGTMTIKMLNDEFERVFAVESETKKKCVRFFLQAVKANGFTLSKFLLDQTRVSSGPRKKRGPKRELEAVDDFDDDVDAAPAAGTEKIITLKSGGQLSVSLSVDLFALSSSDRMFVFGLIDSLQEYEATASAPIVSVPEKETNR